MASTMAQALKESLLSLGGIREKQEIVDWIRARHPHRWKHGTYIGHLYGTRVNHPLAYRHHPGQPKFLFDHGNNRYELYDPRRHGYYKNGVPLPDSVLPGWILIHAPKQYGPEAAYSDPIQQLRTEFEPGLLWHWNLSRPMKASARPRLLLLSWKGQVFGEAIATITREINPSLKREYSFAFELLTYRRLRKAIKFSELALGDREHNHRSLIKLDPKVMKAYRTASEMGRSGERSSPEVLEAEAFVEANSNPGRKGSGQRFFRNPEEKKCVELQGMKVAKAHLESLGYEATDVSRSESFDFSAWKDGKEFIVEVKGTTGGGAEILISHKEVELHLKRHPANILIIVHSIRLKRSATKPSARGGVVVFKHPWQIEEKRLCPVGYSYVV